MKINFVTGGAVAALAAALAFTAVPASAQSHDDRGNHGHWQRQATPAPSSRPAAAREQRAPQAPPQAQARPEQRNWQQGRQQHYTPQAREQRQQQQRTYVPQQQPQRAESWSQRIQRNGTYTDPNRNTNYRDAQRNQSYRDGQRNESYRDGRNGSYRNGNHQAYRGDNHQWNRNWRSNNRYDWQRYRQYNRNVYHVSPYYAPYRNYSYRRLNLGFYLDPLFFGQDYWIGDPGYYRLPDVYGPYRWVRYYDDAVLVDIYSGEVVDVIYDFFW